MGQAQSEPEIHRYPDMSSQSYIFDREIEDGARLILQCKYKYSNINLKDVGLNRDKDRL